MHEATSSRARSAADDFGVFVNVGAVDLQCAMRRDPGSQVRIRDSFKKGDKVTVKVIPGSTRTTASHEHQAGGGNPWLTTSTRTTCLPGP